MFNVFCVLALLVALLLPGASFAGYAQLAPPPAFQSVGGVSTVQVGNAANGARYVGGHVVANASLNLGARTVTVPVAWRVAANAATFTATKMNPWIAGASLAASAIPYIVDWFSRSDQDQLTVDSNGVIRKTSNVPPNHDYSGIDIDRTMTVEGVSLAQQIVSVGANNNYPCGNSYKGVFVYIDGGTCEGGGQRLSVFVCTTTQDYGYTPCIGSGGLVMASPPSVSVTDFAPLTSVSINPAVLPILGIPVPVDPVPVINPATQPTGDVLVGPATNPAPQLQPSPIRFPDGDPVPIPNSTPQRYTQPWQEVVPSPTPTEPWRVDVRPITTIVDSPVPAPDPTPNPSPNPSPVPNFYTDCDKYPGSLGCMPVGSEPPSVEVPKRSLDLTLQSGPSFSGGGCPANLTFNIHGQSLTGINMATPCAWITSYVRPVILLLAAISAVFIILPRSD